MSKKTKDNDRLALNVCAFIMEGHSVSSACAKAGMEERTFYRMLAKDEEGALCQQYAHATRARSHYRAESVDNLMADLKTGVIDAAQARVMLDAIKWQTGKENPKKYGDKLDVTTGGEKIPAPIIQLAHGKTEEGR